MATWDPWDPVTEQRVWTHERLPTMEYSLQCTRIASGEEWRTHTRMLDRAKLLIEEFENQTGIAGVKEKEGMAAQAVGKPTTPKGMGQSMNESVQEGMIP